MTAKRILVVDDDTLICKLLSTYLEQHGFQCHSVHSGEDALELLAERRFYSVITDLKMGWNQRSGCHTPGKIGDPGH